MKYLLDKNWYSSNYDKSFKSSAPGNIYWYGLLISGLENDFKENLKIMDYGCGNGALGNFINGKLSNFIYYGLEPEGSEPLKLDNSNLRSKNNFFFNFINQETLNEALKICDHCILGSVFTHLEWNDSEKIILNLLSLLNKGGKIIFSCFLNNKYRLYEKSQLFPNINYYHIVHITENQIKKFCFNNKIEYKISKNWYEGKHGKPHRRHNLIILSKSIKNQKDKFLV